MNSGKERYVCFIHDFNLCRDCVQKSLKWREKVTEAKTVLVPKGGTQANCCNNQIKTAKVSVDCEVPTRPNRLTKPKHSKQSSPADTRPTSEIEIIGEQESDQAAADMDNKKGTWSRSKSYAHAINT